MAEIDKETIGRLFDKNKGEKVTVSHTLSSEMNCCRSSLYYNPQKTEKNTPKGKQIKMERDKRIMEEYDNGESVQNIAAIIGYTERTVKKIIGKESLKRRLEKNDGKCNLSQMWGKLNWVQKVMLVAVGLLVLSVLTLSIDIIAWNICIITLSCCMGGAYYIVFGYLFSILRRRITERQIRIYQSIIMCSLGVMIMVFVEGMCLANLA